MPRGAGDFVGHFTEQGGWLTLLIVAAMAAGFLGLVVIAVLAMGRPAREQRKRFLLSVAICLGALVPALTIYELAALYVRSDPPGSGLDRSDYDTFVSAAHTSFVGLYALLVGIAVLLGRTMLGSWRGAIAVAGTVAAFMVLTFPFVDFLTECNVGMPLIAWGVQRC